MYDLHSNCPHELYSIVREEEAEVEWEERSGDITVYFRKKVL